MSVRCEKMFQDEKGLKRHTKVYFEAWICDNPAFFRQKENGKKKMKKNKMNLLKTDSNTVTYLRWESRQQGDRSPLSCNPGVRAFFFFGERRGNTRRERRGNTQCDNLRGFRTG